MTTRQPRGIPVGGQFATETHGEPDLQLGSLKLVLPDDPFLPPHGRLPDLRPPGADICDDRWADMIVGGVEDGQLSRGVVNAQRRKAFRIWHDWCNATRGEAHQDFALGLRMGVCALYERHLPHYEQAPPNDSFEKSEEATDQALEIARTKRTSAADREHWRLTLQRAATPAQWRGHLAAGVILSGQDQYWGMRENPDRVVTG